MNFADGSRATVGPESTIAYATESWDKKRAVSLEGQAFFEVEKGEDFIVTTPAGSVKVLGTQFDVWATHPDYMRVACTEGKVLVTSENGKSEVLTAGQVIYITGGALGKVNNLTAESLEWMDNFRNYQTTPVNIVLKDLERFYTVTFDIEKSLADDPFTGVLPVNDLEKCIRFLETSLSYDAEQSGTKVYFEQ